MRPERFFAVLFAALGVASIVGHAASLANSRSAFWGLNAAAFLPAPVTIAFIAATLLIVLWLLGLRLPPLDRGAARLATLRVPRFALPVLVVVSGIVYWNLRSRQTVLGDAWSLVTDLPAGLAFHQRQPFAIGLQQVGYRLAGGGPAVAPGAGIPLAITSVAIVNVVMGLVFVVLAWALGRWILRASDDDEKPAADFDMTAFAITLLLLTQGYVLLFFGYIETYAAYAVCMAAFLLAALAHLRGRLPLAVPALVFVFTIGLHMSAVILAPAFAFLALRGLVRKPERRAAWRDLAITAVGIVVLDQVLRRLAPDYSLWKGITRILNTASHDQGSGAGAVYLLSMRHWRDFLNEQYLLGPIAGLAFLPALVFAWLRNALRKVAVGYLALVAAILLGASWATSDPALGYARDWDLFAPTGVAFTAAVAIFLVTLVRDAAARFRLLTGAILLSVLHLVPWAFVNHSEARSMERFATLPLGQGRNEVVIGNWHLRNARQKEAIVWFEKAIQVEPRNSNAYAFLGHIYAMEQDWPRAAEAMRRAMMLRLDKPLLRRNYVQALEVQGKYAETIPHYEILCQKEPELVGNWVGWARALRAGGETDKAMLVLEKARARYEPILARNPRSVQANLDVGTLYAQLGRPDESLALFKRSLEIDPQSAAGLYNTGGVLVAMGRVEEARPFLQQMLQLYPNHERAEEVRGWIGLSQTP